MPQQPTLPEDMTGFEYVLLGRSPYVGYFGSETRHDRAMAHSVLDRLDLSDFTDRRLGELSGGERQRLVIARALAQEAPILLLDEPTSALDIGHQQQALELVARLRRDHGLTVISAMHDLTLAGQYADRLALLYEGQCVARGPCRPGVAGRDTGRVLRRPGDRAPRARWHRGRHPPPQPERRSRVEPQTRDEHHSGANPVCGSTLDIRAVRRGVGGPARPTR